MQTKIPIMKTSLDSLWDKDGEAKYQLKFLELPDKLDKVLKRWKKECPLPAISFYVDKEQSYKHPSFLSIQDITYDREYVSFSFRLISQLPNITSLDFAKKLENNEKKRLFYTVGYDKINSVLEVCCIINRPPSYFS